MRKQAVGAESNLPMLEISAPGAPCLRPRVTPLWCSPYWQSELQSLEWQLQECDAEDEDRLKKTDNMNEKRDRKEQNLDWDTVIRRS
jgi:hypothetical protein